MARWLVKSEPHVYAWDTFVADGRTAWTGVRNHQARLHLLAMKVGEQVLYYHSGDGKAVVGIAEVTREAYLDPTADDPRWVCVDLAPVRALARPVTLARFKADPALAASVLVKNSRLSVQPVSDAEFAHTLTLGG